MEIVKVHLKRMENFNEKKGNPKPNEDFLSVRHLLPRTKISHTILHDNISQNRLLEGHKMLLEQRAKRHRLLVDRTKKNFLNTQIRKRGKWKREDDVRINCLNLPPLNSDPDDRPGSMEVLYKSPNYYVGSPDDKPLYVPLRPVMGIDREQTELLSHKSQISLSRLPTIIKVSNSTLDRYDRYRGVKYFDRTIVEADPRFHQCEKLLSKLGVRTPSSKKTPAVRNELAKQAGATDQRRSGFFLNSPYKQLRLPVPMNGRPPYLSRNSSTHGL